jgi:hypothetical protein
MKYHIGNCVVLTGEDMLITEVMEREDGSAIATVDLSKEETAMLVEYAIIKLLKEAMDRNCNAIEENKDESQS